MDGALKEDLPVHINIPSTHTLFPYFETISQYLETQRLWDRNNPHKMGAGEAHFSDWCHNCLFFPLFPKTQGELHSAAPDFAKIVQIKYFTRRKSLSENFKTQLCEDLLPRQPTG